MILTEPTYMMHGLSNLSPVSTSSSMLVPVQLVVSASASSQTPMGQQYCTIMMPGGQVRGKRSWERCPRLLSVTATLSDYNPHRSIPCHILAVDKRSCCAPLKIAGAGRT
jgi:hypothetical protein